MKAPRVGLASTGVLLLAVLLTACGGGGNPADTPVAETQQPTPTVTFDPLARPATTLPLACADILTDAQASAIAAYQPVTLQFSEQTAPRNADEVAFAQVGGTKCTWGGEGRTDNGFDSSVILEILPDAAADFDKHVWQVDDGATPYPDGSTTSEYLCPPQQPYCYANLLEKGYWVRAQVSGAPTESAMQDLLDTLAAVIDSAGAPAPGWVAPADVLSGKFCSGGDTSTAVVRSALGNDSLAPGPNTGPEYDYLLAQAAGADRSAYVRCNWSGVSDGVGIGLGVEVVPGGTWALPLLQAQLPSLSWDLPALVPITVPGADSAVYACSSFDDFCLAVLSVGGSAVQLGFNSSDASTAPGILAAVTAAVSAAG